MRRRVTDDGREDSGPFNDDRGQLQTEVRQLGQSGGGREPDQEPHVESHCGWIIFHLAGVSQSVGHMGVEVAKAWQLGQAGQQPGVLFLLPLPRHPLPFFPLLGGEDFPQCA